MNRDRMRAVNIFIKLKTAKVSSFQGLINRPHVDKKIPEIHNSCVDGLSNAGVTINAPRHNIKYIGSTDSEGRSDGMFSLTKASALSLTLNMLDKKSNRRPFDCFSYFSQKVGFNNCIVLKILHELSKPIFWGKLERKSPVGRLLI